MFLGDRGAPTSSKLAASGRWHTRCYRTGTISLSTSFGFSVKAAQKLSEAGYAPGGQEDVADHRHHLHAGGEYVSPPRTGEVEVVGVGPGEALEVVHGLDDDLALLGRLHAGRLRRRRGYSALSQLARRQRTRLPDQSQFGLSSYARGGDGDVVVRPSRGTQSSRSHRRRLLPHEGGHHVPGYPVKQRHTVRSPSSSKASCPQTSEIGSSCIALPLLVWATAVAPTGQYPGDRRYAATVFGPGTIAGVIRTGMRERRSAKGVTRRAHALRERSPCPAAPTGLACRWLRRSMVLLHVPTGGLRVRP